MKRQEFDKKDPDIGKRQRCAPSKRSACRGPDDGNGGGMHGDHDGRTTAAVYCLSFLLSLFLSFYPRLFYIFSYSLESCPTHGNCRVSLVQRRLFFRRTVVVGVHVCCDVRLTSSLNPYENSGEIDDCFPP